MAAKNMIAIVGCGPGGKDYITPAALKEIKRAEVLVGTRRLLDSFGTRGIEKIEVSADIAAALDRIAACRKKKVAVLVTGDPGLRSLATPVINRFGRSACRIIPGISAVQAAFARTGLDWTGARIITAHSKLPQTIPSKLKAEQVIAVLAGHENAAAWLNKLSSALAGTHLAFVCNDLTLPSESIRRIRPGAKLNKLLSTRSIVLFTAKGLIK